MGFAHITRRFVRSNTRVCVAGEYRGDHGPAPEVPLSVSGFRVSGLGPRQMLLIRV